MSILPRLVVLVLAVLLLALACVTAGGARPAGALLIAAEPAATAVLEADPSAAPGGETEGVAAAAVGASAALDLDDPADALALAVSGVAAPPLRHERADLSPREVPTPWLASPLRPPRTLLG